MGVGLMERHALGVICLKAHLRTWIVDFNLCCPPWAWISYLLDHTQNVAKIHEDSRNFTPETNQSIQVRSTRSRTFSVAEVIGWCVLRYESFWLSLLWLVLHGSWASQFLKHWDARNENKRFTPLVEPAMSIVLFTREVEHKSVSWTHVTGCGITDFVQA